MFVSLVLALALSAPVTESITPPPDAPAAAAAMPAAAAAASTVEGTAAPAPGTSAAAPPPTQAPAIAPPPPASALPPPPALAPVAPAAPGLAAPAGAPPPAPRRAPFPPAHSFHAAVGLGAASAGGSAESGVAMSDLTHEQLDLQLEVGFRFAQRLYLDLYVEAGAGDAGSGATALCASSCSSSRVASGIQAKLAFAPRRRFNPWIGIGVGIEQSSLSGNPRTISTAAVRTTDWHHHDWPHGSSSSASTHTLVSYTGFELPRLSAGVDWRLHRIVGVGLFANLSFTRYDTIGGDLGSSTDSVSGGAHTWFVVGARAILFP